MVDWYFWRASTHCLLFWPSCRNRGCFGKMFDGRLYLVSVSLLHVLVFRERRGYRGQPCEARAGAGWEQGRAGCSLSRESEWLVSPRQITLFWARRDDIMTDSDEAVGTRGRKPLSPTMAPWRRVEGDADTQVHTHRWRSNTLILYFSHSPLNTHRNTHLCHVHSR